MNARRSTDAYQARDHGTTQLRREDLIMTDAWTTTVDTSAFDSKLTALRMRQPARFVYDPSVAGLRAEARRNLAGFPDVEKTVRTQQAKAQARAMATELQRDELAQLRADVDRSRRKPSKLSAAKRALVKGRRQTARSKTMETGHEDSRRQAVKWAEKQKRPKAASMRQVAEQLVADGHAPDLTRAMTMLQRKVAAARKEQRRKVISDECRAGQAHRNCKGVVAGKDGVLALCSCSSCHPSKAASVKQLQALVGAAMLPGSGDLTKPRKRVRLDPLNAQLRAERRMVEARRRR